MAGGAPIRISILANANQAKRELSSFSSTLKRTIGAGAALAGAYGGVQLLKDIAGAGSEAQQTLGGTTAVFKKHAAQVVASSKKAADTVGLSGNQYRTNATLIGSLLKGQGVAMDKLAGKTDQLIGLGADLAATYGGTTKDAVESLTSAFKGEFDPIEKYGISLKQSTVTAEAAAIAQKKHGKALKDLSIEQQTAIKQQATYRLIMEKSADAQGQFASESDTAAGKQQRLRAEIEDTKAKLGTSLLPLLSEAADVARSELVPALDEFGDWFADNVDDIVASGKSIAKTFVPPLQVTADVAAAAAKALDSIPGPVKEFGVELLIAAKAFKILNAATTAGTGQISAAVAPFSTYRAEVARATSDFRAGTLTQNAYTQSVTKSAQTLGSQLRPAVAGAAGMAGMGLLLASTQQNDKALGGLMKAAGGAATGFAVGGPLGGAVGGLAGLLWGARDAYNATERATRKAAAEAAKTESWGTAKAAALELRDALYGTRDAYNEVTAASVKKGLFADGKKVGWVKDLEGAGVNIDTITRAILGQRDAQNLVNQAFAKQDASLVGQKDKISAIRAEIDSLGQLDLGNADEADVIRLGELQDQLKQLTMSYDEERTAIDARKQSYGALAGTTEQQVALERRLRAELGLSKRQYDAMPANVRTKIEAEGLPQFKQSVLDLLATTDKLNGRQVVAIVKQSGAQLARAEVDKLQRKFDLTPKQVATLLKVNGANKAKADAGKAGKDAGNAFGRNTAAGVSAHAGEVRGAAVLAMERARSAAAAEARASSSVGAQMAAGFAAGIGTGGVVASAARSVIRSALAAARHEAEIRSPSRKAAKDGKNIAKGYAKGIREGWPDVRRAITSGMGSLFERQTSPVTQYLSEVRSQIRSSLKGKAEYRALKAVDQYSAKIRRTYDAWKKTSAQLEKAREKLESLKQEAASFKSSVQSSVKGWFDPIGSALEGSGAFTNQGGLLGAILGDAKTQAAQISQTTNLLDQAAKRGLSKDAYEKILSLSPEDANKTAVALASATEAQINELNGYYSAVDKQAAASGNQAYDSFFKVGIRAQQGIVDGLLKDKKAIEQAADKLGAALEKAVKRRLGIKSPSRVFREIGNQVTNGLELGVDVPRATRMGSEMAAGLERGFDPKALVATAQAGAAPSSGGTVINLTVNAPVGSSPADIGRDLANYLRAYKKVGGNV